MMSVTMCLKWRILKTNWAMICIMTGVMCLNAGVKKASKHSMFDCESNRGLLK